MPISFDKSAKFSSLVEIVEPVNMSLIRKTVLFSWVIFHFIFVVLLVFSGFSLKHSISVGFIASLTSYLGLHNYLAISKRNDHNILELIGAGTAFGTFLPAVLALFIRSFLGIPSYFGFICFFAISAVIWLKSARSDLDCGGGNTTALLITGSASSAAFGQFIPLFYIASLFLGLLAVLHKLHKSKQPDYSIRPDQTILILLSVVAVAVSSIQNRLPWSPLWRSMTYVDQIFDETQSWSIARYGITDNAFAVGYQMPGHTLTHSWAGLIQLILDTPIFMASGAAGTLLGIMGTSALIGGFALKSKHTMLSLIGALGLWTLQMSLVDQLGVSANPRVSNNLSLLWFTFTLILLLEFRNNLLRGAFIVLPLIVGLTGLSKLHWGIYLVGVFGLISLIEAARFRRITSLAILSMSGVVLICVYLIFLRGMNSFYSPVYMFSFSTAVTYAAVFINRSLGFYTKPLTNDQSTLKRAVIISALFFVPLIALTGGANQEAYFITCSTILIAMMAGPHVLHLVQKMRTRNVVAALIYFVFILSASVFSIGAYWKFYVRAEYSSFWKLIFNLFQIRDALFLALIIVLAAVFSLMKRNADRKSNFQRHFVLLALFGNFAFMIAQSTQSIYMPRIYGSQLTELGLTDQQLEVGSWLRINSKQSDILASNHYCQTVVNVGDRVPITPEECRHRNLNSWVAATSHRRMLLEAPITSVFGPGRTLPQDLVDRYNISLLFGSSPNSDHLADLKSYGVTFFVLEKAFSSVQAYSNFGRLVFENEQFAILEI
jgi:hypothetical protein